MNEHLEADGPDVFHHACKLGLEGIVSKRKDSAYRSGRSPDWLKMKLTRRASAALLPKAVGRRDFSRDPCLRVLPATRGKPGAGRRHVLAVNARLWYRAVRTADGRRGDRDPAGDLRTTCDMPPKAVGRRDFSRDPCLRVLPATGENRGRGGEIYIFIALPPTEAHPAIALGRRCTRACCEMLAGCVFESCCWEVRLRPTAQHTHGAADDNSGPAITPTTTATTVTAITERLNR